MAKKFVADALATTGVEQQYKSQHLTDPQLVTAVVLSPKFPLSLNKFMGNPEFLSLYAEVLNDPAVINARAGNNAAAREAMTELGTFEELRARAGKSLSGGTAEVTLEEVFLSLTGGGDFSHL